jgi:hypothetical protein
MQLLIVTVKKVSLLFVDSDYRRTFPR